MMSYQSVDELIKKEGWELTRDVTEKGIIEYIIAEGVKYEKRHPFFIHGKLYRDSLNPAIKYMHMKAMHDYLWPNAYKTWHFWTERRFRAHCAGWKSIGYAGGAGTTKSYDAAKIALLFWLADPKHRGVVIASVTLGSVQSRIWGYVTKLLQEAAIELPYHYTSGNAPQILYPTEVSTNGKVKDTINGMFAVAAKAGTDSKTTNTWIGRHPDRDIMVVLDEATDMPAALLEALVNLEKGVETFQFLAIGNSLDIYDLHGIFCTPKDGWPSIDPMKDVQWDTTRDNGTCLFFSCYESPAVLEKDPVRREALGKFLITQEAINNDKLKKGEDTDDFWRMTLGFWRLSSTSNTVISKQFIETYRVFDRTEWSGLEVINVVAGLDPAFSTGGDSCILRLAFLGLSTKGQIVLDYGGDRLMFKVPILARSDKSAELQIADFVIQKLSEFHCPLRNLAIDAAGQGRALGEVIKLRMNSLESPIKIYGARVAAKEHDDWDIKVMSNHELWFTFRQYIQEGQIKGLDTVSVQQLTTRLVKMKGKTVVLESKPEYKTRMGGIMPTLAHSPDEADACALALQSAILNFGFAPGQRKEVAEKVDFYDAKMWAAAHLGGLNVPGQKGGSSLTAPQNPVVLKAGFGKSVEAYAQVKRRHFQ